MSTTSHLFLIGFGLLFFFIIIYLLLKFKISEKYSIIWLISGFGILIISSEPRILDLIAKWVGIDYPPSLLFLLSTLILLVFLLYQSIELSKLHQKIKLITQTLALLEARSDSNIQNNEIKELKQTLNQLALTIEHEKVSRNKDGQD